MSYALGITVFGPAVAVMARDLHVSETAAGALSFWMSLGFLGTTLFGWVRPSAFSLKALAALGATGIFSGLLAVSFGSGYVWAAAGMVLFGIGGACTQIAGNASVSDLFPNRRALALNIYHTGFGIAALAGPRFSGLLIADGAGWRTVYLYAAIAALIPLPAFLMSRFPGSPGATPADDTGAVSLVTWRDPVLLAAATGIFFYVGAEIGTNNWLALYLQRERGFGPFEAAVAVSDFWLALTAGRLAVIFATTRVAPVRLLLVLVTCALAASGLLLMAPAGTRLWVVSLGAAFSGIFATLFAIAVSRFPARSAEMSALLSAAAGLGILLLAPSIGFVSGWFGFQRGYSLTLVYTAALFVCGLLVAARRREE